MKYKKRWWLAGIGVLVAVLLVMLIPPTVGAAASVFVDPDEGEVGEGVRAPVQDLWHSTGCYSQSA